jgi:hypothetical protein
MHTPQLGFRKLSNLNFSRGGEQGNGHVAVRIVLHIKDRTNHGCHGWVPGVPGNGEEGRAVWEARSLAKQVSDPNGRLIVEFCGTCWRDCVGPVLMAPFRPALGSSPRWHQRSRSVPGGKECQVGHSGRCTARALCDVVASFEHRGGEQRSGISYVIMLAARCCVWAADSGCALSRDAMFHMG